MKDYLIISYEEKYLEKLQKVFFKFSNCRKSGKMLDYKQICFNVEKYLTDDNVKVFIAYSKDKEIIGFIFGKIKELNGLYTEKRIFGNIEYLFVSENFRGNGISTKLKNEYISYLLNRNIKELRIKFYETNLKAAFVYEKWGFKKLKKEMVMDI